MEIQIKVWDRYTNCRVKPQPSCPDNWISNGNTHREKQMIKKPAQIRFHSKRPHSITNVKDNINMNSTIAVSMNAICIEPFIRHTNTTFLLNITAWCFNFTRSCLLDC